MQTSAIDVKTMTNELALFDQAVSASAANMKANFDMQIAGISQTFAATFQAIDATIAISAANFNLAFGTAALLRNCFLCIKYMAHRNRQYIAVRNGIAVIVYKVPVETVYITCSRFTEGMCRIAPYPLKAFCVTVFDDKNRMRGVVIAVVGRREFDAVPR